MTKHEIILVLLASADGAPLTPVQLQKAAFLVDRQAKWLITSGEFHFEPYDYGPFDPGVYKIAEALAAQGDVVISQSPGARWSTYAASANGVANATRLAAQLQPKVRDYLRNVIRWVRSQSFSGLVKSIYQAYPDMRVNSIFNG